MHTDLKITLIAAIAQNGVIGKNGVIPWILKSDLRRFKELTIGNTVLMGRKTYESIGKPLSGRDNIVLTKQNDFVALGCKIAHSWEEALNLADKEKTLFVIGGTELYKIAIDLADTFLLTEVEAEINGDTFFPEWDRSSWKETKTEKFSSNEDDQFPYCYTVLQRKNFCNLQNAREDSQLKAMQRINGGGFCPFCFENFKIEHKKPILKIGKYWFVTENQWPYKETKKHFLIISLFHTEKLNDLPLEAFAELLELCQNLEKEFGIQSGGLCIRFGDTNFNGATVNHLHCHILQPDPDQEPIKFWIGKRK